ncbi:MAG: nuclear transport factor 2 family protein [Solirubrobacterales bacterium]
MGSNADLVERFRAAFSGGDVDGALACLSPDAEILPIRARLEGTTYRGHEGYRHLLTDFDQDWDDLRLHVDELREKGEYVIASSRISAQGRASGVELDVPLAVVFEVRDDLVVRMESFEQLDAALAAAGLSK